MSVIRFAEKVRRYRWRIALSAVLATTLSAALLWVCNPPPVEEARVFPFGTVVRDSRGAVMRVVLNDDGQDCRPYYRPSRDDWIVKAIIAAEDGSFYSHKGVVLSSVARAALQNVSRFRTVSGASTITMQTVRLIKPHSRNVLNKIFEAVKAVRLEREMTKDEILAQYLNRLPFGANLVGIEAASQAWFGCRPADLGIAQAALLAGLPQSPSRLRPDRYPERALKRRNYVLGRMLALGYITDEEYSDAISIKPLIRTRARPFLRPWFCDYVLRTGAKDLRGNVVTTLDPQMQQIAESGLEALSLADGGTAAAVILSVRDSSLLAMASTGSFFAPQDGQVNAAAMARPAGSTLKPFIFALGIDSGILVPESVLPDIPRQFGSYAPKNFDGKFRGLATARESLILSLNLPAIELLGKVGMEKFAGNLGRLELLPRNQDLKNQGLGVAVGSLSVRLVELANAYAVFARGGRYLPCRTLSGGEEGPAIPSRVYSSGAAWMITDMLSGQERSAGAFGHNADAVIPRFAWKTGTSAGFRDAWTVAWNPEYVVAVWIGSKQGRGLAGNPTGLGDAAPAVWRIARSLYPSGDSPWFAKDPQIAEREICGRSGLVPGPFCRNLRKTPYITGLSLWTVCNIHFPGENGEIIEKWPPDIEKGLLSVKSGEVARPSAGVTIESPADGSVFKRLDGMESGKIRCRVKDGTTSPRLFWFLNGRFVESLPPADTFSFPKKRGHFSIAVSDEFGNADEITVRVK